MNARNMVLVVLLSLANLVVNQDSHAQTADGQVKLEQHDLKYLAVSLPPGKRMAWSVDQPNGTMTVANEEQGFLLSISYNASFFQPLDQVAFEQLRTKTVELASEATGVPLEATELEEVPVGSATGRRYRIKPVDVPAVPGIFTLWNCPESGALVIVDTQAIGIIEEDALVSLHLRVVDSVTCKDVAPQEMGLMSYEILLDVPPWTAGVEKGSFRQFYDQQTGTSFEIWSLDDEKKRSLMTPELCADMLNSQLENSLADMQVTLHEKQPRNTKTGCIIEGKASAEIEGMTRNMRLIQELRDCGTDYVMMRYYTFGDDDLSQVDQYWRCRDTNPE